MNELDMKDYHEWLLNRSMKGYLYRKYYLYPRIWAEVSGSILDVGCGIGDFVQLTSGSVGADINMYNVEYCKKKSIPAVIFFNNHLPFNDEHFDSVIFDNVIEHIYDSSEVIEESLRVLRKGGRLVLGVPVLRHFFHDDDHKIYHSDASLRGGLNFNNIQYEKNFLTPSNVLIQRVFKHTCRWYVYTKI